MKKPSENMLFSKKSLILIITPLIIEQLLIIMTGTFDSIMVSSAGEAAVSGVSLVDTVNLLLTYLFTALCSGGAIVTAQLIGQKDFSSAKESAKQLIWVCLFLSTALTILTVFLRIPLLNLIFGKIEYDVMESAKIYFLFTALSYPFLAIQSACSAIFRVTGNSKTPMLISLLANLVNICGNAILIYVFNMGAAGAAIATLFSRIISALISIIIAHSKKQILHIDNVFKYKPQFYLIKKMCAIGIPNGVENAMFQLGKVLTQSLISGFGTIQIAANAVANSLSNIQYASGTAISISMNTVVGQCVGAEEKEQAKYYTKKLLSIAYVCIIFVSIILCVFAEPIISLYNLPYESSNIARNIMYLHSAFICSIWPLAFPLSNAFRSASDVKYTMIIAMFSMWTFRVGLSYVFALLLGLEVYGVWFAMFCDWFFRFIVFSIRFKKGTWLSAYNRLQT